MPATGACGGPHFDTRLKFNHASADTTSVEASSRDELRQELARLEAQETQLSAQRRFLHQQIDFGYASEETRIREREVSDERRALDQRIDSLREILGVQEVT